MGCVPPAAYKGSQDSSATRIADSGKKIRGEIAGPADVVTCYLQPHTMEKFLTAAMVEG